jgi:hypothetical protein
MKFERQRHVARREAQESIGIGSGLTVEPCWNVELSYKREPRSSVHLRNQQIVDFLS